MERNSKTVLRDDEIHHYDSPEDENKSYAQLQDRQVNRHVYDDLKAEELKSDVTATKKTQPGFLLVRRKVAYAVFVVFPVVCVILCAVTGLAVYKISVRDQNESERLDVGQLEDNKLSSWSYWGSCTVTCGCGYRHRTRSCYEPSPISCDGESVEAIKCCKSKCFQDLSRHKRDWLLMFRGIAGTGTDLESAWFDGISTKSVDENCTKLGVCTCTSHYRNPLVDQWRNITIKQVKYSLYQNKVESAYVIFNGSGSTVESWFGENNIIMSSWEHVSNYKYNIEERCFSIKGAAEARRFAISIDMFDECRLDRSFTVTITKESKDECDYDRQPSYPQFLFVGPNSFETKQYSVDFRKADTMEISIKLY